MEKYVCHCNVSAFDGVNVITAKPTITVSVAKREDVMSEAKNQLIKQYEKKNCSNVNVTFALIKKIGGKRFG